uniref:Chromosome 1 open reading frame 56 n=1 Tax=Cavia porcellus TaxID=10141 RepID=A0A286XWZ0_CAVPO
MVPAACTLLWALLLSLGSAAAAAGHQGQTRAPAGTRGVSLSFGSPARSRSSSSSMSRSARTRFPRRTRVTEEDESDAHVTADRLAGPAAEELLATVTGISSPATPGTDEDEDGSLEEGVAIYARKSRTPGAGSHKTSSRAVSRRRPSPLPPSAYPSPSAALAFWKRVRTGLEDIWNSLSSVFTEMQPVSRILKL